MDRNLILAVALSILIYVGWFKIMEIYYPKTDARPAVEAAAAKARAPEAAPIAPPARPAPLPEASLGPPDTQPMAERGGREGAVAYHVGKLGLLVQPLGGSLVSYRYPGPLGEVELVEDPQPGFFSTWPSLRFEPVDDAQLWPVLEAKHPSGVRIRKEYLFHDLGAVHTLRFTFTNPAASPARIAPWRMRLGPGIGTVASEQKENSAQWDAIALWPPPKGKKKPVFEALDADDVDGEFETRESGWDWVGVHNRYFLAAFRPAGLFGKVAYGATRKSVERASWTGGKKRVEVEAPWIGSTAGEIDVPAGGTVRVEIPFYFGPKGYTRLRHESHGLQRTVSFGWFHVIGAETMKVLEFFHGKVGNWGWAIILLTICIQVLMFPVTYKQMKSMAIMKQIQPEITKIQQKYKKDPKRLQVEMMEVYKKHGANPLSGCLPILVQMPIFIALFNMLRGAWELHGAPWIFWIHDLSARDPYYVLPVVMGGIMFLQNKMNPQTATDPNQAKMMTYLPVIFTFMFLNFPAGLVLYWLTNSMLSFVQQIVIKRRMDARA